MYLEQLTFDCPPEPDPDSAPPIRRHPRAFSVVRRRVRSYTNLFHQKDQNSVDGSAQDETESKQPEVQTIAFKNFHYYIVSKHNNVIFFLL